MAEDTRKRQMIDVETPNTARLLSLPCCATQKGARPLSLENDLGWYRITSWSWPYPLLATATIYPVLAGSRTQTCLSASLCACLNGGDCQLWARVGDIQSHSEGPSPSDDGRFPVDASSC